MIKQNLINQAIHINHVDILILVEISIFLIHIYSTQTLINESINNLVQYAHRLFFSRRKKNWKFPFRYYLKRNKLDKKIIKTIITIIILQFQYRWINIYLSLALVLFSIIVSYISISLSLSSSLWRAIGGFQIVNENHFWMKKTHSHSSYLRLYFLFLTITINNIMIEWMFDSHTIYVHLSWKKI